MNSKETLDSSSEPELPNDESAPRSSRCNNAMHPHAQFYAKLADLLDEYDVDLDATDDDQPYGQHLPLINIQFNRDGYRSDELTSISSDRAREMSKVCEDENA